jgi:uncharacterized protein YndB with AHSA1/START domain
VVVASDRRFRFDADRDTVWRALTAVDAYPAWWPWLRDFDGRALAAGERWRCTVQPPLPYRLRFTLGIDEVVEGERVAATLSGDLVGTAHLELAATASGSEIRLVSSLEPAHVVVRGVARIAQPVARYGHDWVLRTGVRQFAAAL